FSAPRDRWSGRVYISHGGGAAENEDYLKTQPTKRSRLSLDSTLTTPTRKPASTSTSNGPFPPSPPPTPPTHTSVLYKSQEETDRSIAALINTCKTREPFVAIMGSGYKLADFQVPHRYCVLG
ncbi:hypothetical protein HK097_006009, partial [Rhizophlyctis rosea]